MSVRIMQGDCREVMRTLTDASVDAIVCDPPYELGFMGKGWDATGIANDVGMWREALRVLKPGGHLLAFGGTRTYHRMVCAVEDAGFEVRDQIGWLYGSGFPKSLDVAKAIDKVRDWSKVERLNVEIRRAREAAGLSLREIGEAMQTATAGQYGAWYHRGGHMFFETGLSLPSRPEWGHLQRVLPIAAEFAGVYDEAEREVIGQHADGSAPGGFGEHRFSFNSRAITAPATATARQWQGWGTALKPAWEPIVLARKPLQGTVAANVLAHGTGALNIDGCRIGGAGVVSGRWPANIVHDGSDEVVAAFPEAPDAFAPVRGTERSSKTGDIFGDFDGRAPSDQRDGGGSAARFFYTAKASASERTEGLHTVTQRGRNHHPTVKPTDLMRYLCRLVTPPGGTVLDPFMGSGSTLKAAELEGFSAIGIDIDATYVELARRRIAADIPLFAEVMG